MNNHLHLYLVVMYYCCKLFLLLIRLIINYYQYISNTLLLVNKSNFNSFTHIHQTLSNSFAYNLI